MVVVERREGEGEEMGGRGRDEFSLGVFYNLPELVWGQQLVAHARTSLTHRTPRGDPWLNRSIPFFFFKSFYCDFECVVQISCNSKTTAIGYVPATFAAALASSAAATAGFTFLPSFHRTLGGGARFLRPVRDRTRTTETKKNTVSFSVNYGDRFRKRTM